MKIFLRLFLLLLGLSFFWVPILILTQQGYPYWYFVDIPSLVTLIIPAFLIQFAFYNPKQIFSAVGHLKFIHVYELDALKESLKVWRNFGITLIAWGGVLTLYNVVNMMRNISNPEVIGDVLILSYNSTLYGILLATVLAFPAYLIIEKRLSIANGMSESYLSASGFRRGGQDERMRRI
ncbi:hypothetical protein K8I31_10090, partial [bacterium]|nr:hypothetical protein [bacterium]